MTRNEAEKLLDGHVAAWTASLTRTAEVTRERIIAAMVRPTETEAWESVIRVAGGRSTIRCSDAVALITVKVKP